MRKGFLSILGSFGVVSAVAVGSYGKSAPQFPLYKEGEVIVKLKRSKYSAMSVGAQTNAVYHALGQKYAINVQPLETDKTLLKIEIKNDAPMGQILGDIQANSLVEYAEPNYYYHTFDLPNLDDALKAVIPNDPNFNLNWGLLNTGQKDAKGQEGTVGVDIDATKAWEKGTGSKDIVVAVIDTGVDYNHEDLKNNIYVNAKEVAGDGVDNDKNGFVDDVRGWNFQGKNNDPMDDNRHGTHCAGTIGADGNNGIGTAGVNWKVTIMPIKFLNSGGGGSLADATESIKYATKMGVHVMSNSWGGGGFSQTMFNAIKEAKDKGILFVAAAGNESNDNDAKASYPATYDLENVISVAATDNKDQKASWSNYGKTKVHLAAPGVNIYSTFPTNKDSYGNASGTSMACPHVAGAAALLWSLNKNMNYKDIKGRLLATVDPVASLKTKVITGGRLNVNNAIMNIVPGRNEPPANAWKEVFKLVETAHPYDVKFTQDYVISHPGAKFVRVHFSKIGTEAGYDLIKVKNSAGEVIEELSGDKTDYTTEYVVGDKVTLTFTSDSSVTGYGFTVDKYEFVD